MRHGAVFIVLSAGALGCGAWQRVGAPEHPQPGVNVARLFDAADVYRSMGFYVSGPPLPFIGSVRFLRAASPDSTLAFCALSLTNNALSFRRDGNEFVAEYHVEFAFRTDSGAVRQTAADQVVRVRGFQETLRGDETIIFQQFLALRPGVYHVTVLVRDRNGPGLGHQERVDTVPAYVGPSLASPLAFYEGTGRRDASEPPKLLANPKATLPYGGDTLRFYVEGYGFGDRTRLAVRAVNQGGDTVLEDTVPLSGGPGLATAVIALAPDRLPMGQARLVLASLDGSARARTPFLVSFSSQWVITNFDEMISLLRYFDRQDLLDSLRTATPAERPGVWKRFWKATDPVPITPENEALDNYFRRVQVANQRYNEAGDPGWLTDRGEVFITLGEPDEVYDLRGDVSRGGTAVVRWTYNTLQLVLVFTDQTGFGRMRMTPSSRADYQRVLTRVHRMQ
jgi:GWxTD domain-containing protein